MTECRDYFTDSDLSQADYLRSEKEFYQKKKADRISRNAESQQRRDKGMHFK